MIDLLQQYNFDCSYSHYGQYVMASNDLNALYQESEKYFLEYDPDNLHRFYIFSFMRSYEKKRHFKNTLWTHPNITNPELLYKKIGENNLIFLNYCIKQYPQFFTDCNELLSSLIVKSFTTRSTHQQKKILEMCDFLEKNYKAIVLKEIVQVAANKHIACKPWHIHDNPYLKDYERKGINYYDFCVWHNMSNGASILINSQRVPLLGYDGQRYKDILDFITSYLKNDYIRDNISVFSHKKYKYAQSEQNKAKWMKILLEATLPEKPEKSTNKKI